MTDDMADNNLLVTRRHYHGRHCRAGPGNPSSSENALTKLMDTRVKPAYDS
jgi:hypothetical protein